MNRIISLVTARLRHAPFGAGSLGYIGDKVGEYKGEGEGGVARGSLV